MPAPPSAAAFYDSAGRVLSQCGLIFNAVETHFQRVEKRTGLGDAQIWALSIVDARPGIGVKDMALAMDICQPHKPSPAPSAHMCVLDVVLIAANNLRVRARYISLV